MNGNTPIYMLTIIIIVWLFLRDREQHDSKPTTPQMTGGYIQQPIQSPRKPTEDTRA